jgi:hypothetical protein
MNRGLVEDLQCALPNLIQIERPSVPFNKAPLLKLFTGFVDGTPPE